MNERLICFIICTNSELYFSECLFYLNQLVVPEGYETEVLAIKDAKSMAAGYNEGMMATDAKYKVYMHQDVFILNRNFIADLLSVFNSDSMIGMIGMIGPRIMSADGVMWHELRYGSLYGTGYGGVKDADIDEEGNVLWKYKCDYGGDYNDYNYHILEDGVVEVAVIDGLLMATAYDVRWREELFDGWDFYDCSQCMEFRREGYHIVVPLQRIPWCLHDDGIIQNLWRYDKYRKIFMEEYEEFLGKHIESGADNGIIKKHVYHDDVVTKMLLLQKTEKKDILRKYKYVMNEADAGIRQRNIGNLILLGDYLQSEGKIIIPYFPDIHRLVIIINIIKNEEQNKLNNNIITDACDFEELSEKYVKLCFWLRRIEMNYFELSKVDIIDFFVKQNVSCIAIYSIILNEYIMNGIYISCMLYTLLAGSTAEKTAVSLLDIFSRQEIPIKEIYYLLADYYLAHNAKLQALDCLQRMPEPDEELLRLIRKLEEKI